MRRGNFVGYLLSDGSVIDSLNDFYPTQSLFIRRKVYEYSEDEKVSIVEQHHKDSCDINNIVNKYMKHGVVPADRSAFAQYGDFSQVKSFGEMMVKMREASQSFMTLPAEVRAHFENDAARFLDAFSDPNQQKYLLDHGILQKKIPEQDPQDISLLKEIAQSLKISKGSKDDL